ncbi:IS5/IS1182 family transposase, partial [Xanthomonas oryzae pv. oryzae]
AKNQGFERPQRRRCGLLHFPAALIRPSIRLRHAPKHMPQPLYS